MSIYERRLLLRSQDVDMHRRLRLSNLFTLLQEASIRHTEDLGMGRDKTLDKGILWIVGMQRANILRMPEYDEQIVIRSWPGQTMHLFFPRYYRIENEAGELLVEASALWMLINEETRQVVFPESAGIVIDGVVTGQECTLPSPPRALLTTETVPFRVPYSYVDLNGHMNNTRYFDLAEDCIPAPAVGARLLTIQTEYSSEAPLGTTLQIHWGQEDNEYYLVGLTQEDKKIFRMRLAYEKN